MTLNDDAEINAAATASPDLYPHAAGGLAFGAVDPSSPDYCRIGLRTVGSGDSYGFCVLLTHELGHLAGHEHSDVPGDVMNAESPTYRPCMGTRIERLDWLLRLSLPRPDTWTISCVVIRGGAVRCTASARWARQVHRFRVSPDLTRQGEIARSRA